MKAKKRFEDDQREIELKKSKMGAEQLKQEKEKQDVQNRLKIIEDKKKQGNELNSKQKQEVAGLMKA